MTDVNNQTIQCLICKMYLTVDELGQYVSANQDTKKQAIEEELQLWGNAYDRNYLIQNVVFCPNCGKLFYFKDWDSSDNSNKKEAPNNKK